MKLYTVTLLAVTMMVNVSAFAKQNGPDIKPGAPTGSCCRVDGNEGSSQQKTLDGVQVWTCKMDSVAFQTAWNKGLLPATANLALRAPFQQTALRDSGYVYPTCPAGLKLAVAAGVDTCIAPIPQCPAGLKLGQDGDGTKDICLPIQ